MARRKADLAMVDEDELTHVVRRLADEVHILRLTLDELREELQWANRNHGDETYQVTPPFRLRSMPLDPAAPDFAARLNRVSPETVAFLRDQVAPPAAADGPSQQQQLW